MKKVIIEQNGHVPMVLSVPEGASVRIEDGVTLVEPKIYIPKDGDCVMCDLVGTGTFYFVYNGDRNSKGHYIVIFDNEAKVDSFLTSKFTHELIATATKITPVELQAEFNKLGYEYDFESHTANRLAWKPKVGGRYKAVNFDDNEIIELIWDNDILDRNWLEMKNVFPPHDTEGVEKYIAHIKSFER